MEANNKRKRDSKEPGERRMRTLSSVNLEKVVGTGTFGVVFQAVDKLSGLRVALKKIKMEKEIQGFPITAIREIKILKALDHENVVKLREIVTFDAEEDGEELKGSSDLINGDVFMVFEFCDFDLSGLLRSRDVTLSMQHVRSYMKQILSGIHYIHCNKILHRDIKGANILVTRGNVIKIADWGLARTVYYTEKQKLTNPVVTQWYRSPELLLGAVHYGPEIDIWSIGCLFGEMLNSTHEPMFRGKSDANQLELIYQDCGTPVGEVEDLFKTLPLYEKYPITRIYTNRLQRKYGHQYDPNCLELLVKLIELHPKHRISAEKALDSDYFWYPEPPVAPEKLLKFNVASAFALQEDERMREEHRLKEEKARQEQADRQARQAGAVGGGGISTGRGGTAGGRGVGGAGGRGPPQGGRKFQGSTKFVITKPTRGSTGSVVPPVAANNQPISQISATSQSDATANNDAVCIACTDEITAETGTT